MRITFDTQLKTSLYILSFLKVRHLVTILSYRGGGIEGRRGGVEVYSTTCNLLLVHPPPPPPPPPGISVSLDDSKKKGKKEKQVRLRITADCFHNLAPSIGVICGLSLLLVLVLAQRHFSPVLRFSPLLKNQYFQIPFRSGISGPP